MAGLIGAILGGALAAILFGSVEGWTYYTGVGADIEFRELYTHFNADGLIWVVIGMIGGAIIGSFGQKVISALNSQNKSNQDSIADEIKKLKILLDNQIITKEEFDKQKSRILNNINGVEDNSKPHNSFNVVVEDVEKSKE